MQKRPITMTRKRLWVGLSLWALGAIALCANAAPLSKGEAVVVGQSAPLTGVLAETGKDMVLGAHIYFEHINSQGGVAGHKIKHVVLDDGYDIERTLANTRELLGKHNALALFGYAGTGNISRLLTDKVLADAGVALVGPYTGGEPLRTPYNPNIFHVRAGYADEAAVMLKMITGSGMRRVGVMYQDDAFGKAGLQGVIDALKPLGLSPVVTASYPKNTTDVDAAVLAIAANQPQAIILISVTKSSAAFLTKYRALSKTSLIFNLSVVNPAAIARSIGDVDTRGFSITQVVPDPLSNALPVAREFRSLLTRYGNGAEPSATSFEEFLAAKTLVAGLRRTKALDRAGVMAGLESLEKHDLGGYTVNFGPGNRRGSRYVDIVAVRKDGKMLR